MANPEHLAKLKEGVEAWNRWREDNSALPPDLSETKLSGTNLSKANLRDANLSRANLAEANLRRADLSWANLVEANLPRSDLSWADLSGTKLYRANLREAILFRAGLDRANLKEAKLYHANVSEAKLYQANVSEANFNQAWAIGTDFTSVNLSGADLSGTDLSMATLVETNLERGNLTSCCVYGISVWNVRLEGAIQSNLVITPPNESVIQVDNLEVAQFVYLLLNNERIRHVIDTITSKVVLILGRFTPERKAVLDAIREALRKRDYLPVLFDFEKPKSRSLTETVSTLAHMARFVIADITDAKSIPQELMRIVPSLPTVPVQPLLLASQHEYGMFDDFRLYPWVLEPTLYADQDALLAELDEKVIAPAEAKAKEQTRNRK
jgi:uncharacterized protein YjbI with pentapeptide repeats